MGASKPSIWSAVSVTSSPGTTGGAPCGYWTYCGYCGTSIPCPMAHPLAQQKPTKPVRHPLIRPCFRMVVALFKCFVSIPYSVASCAMRCILTMG